eukprot:12034618-Ditylum_brightwellii.AAC.1
MNDLDKTEGIHTFNDTDNDKSHCIASPSANERIISEGSTLDSESELNDIEKIDVKHTSTEEEEEEILGCYEK